MKRKGFTFIGLLFVILVMLTLVGCAGWQTKTTQAYKAAGTLGATYYQVAKPSCDQNLLPADKCAMLKKVNNDARSIYIKAGDVLKLAINATDAVQTQQLLAQFNTLMSQFNTVMADFVSLLKQYKILSKGEIIHERDYVTILDKYGFGFDKKWARNCE
jgi:predicted negative regulator of RcsB-dependent stress response